MKRLISILFISLLTTAVWAQTNDLREVISAIIKDKKADVGVAIIYNGVDTITFNNSLHYPTMSVYKFHQSLAVLNFLEVNSISIDEKLFVKKESLRTDTYSPLLSAYPNGNIEISIRDLIGYAVSMSDNNASDLLFDYLVGPKATDLYLRSLGLTEFMIATTEREMEVRFENQYLNWTSPLEAVKLVDKLLKTDVVTGEYKECIMASLLGTKTGLNKLKGLLPSHVVVGHKTGMSSRNKEGLKAADNDLGYIQMPNGSILSIGVFVKDSRESDDTNAAIIAQIAKAAYDHYLPESK